MSANPYTGQLSPSSGGGLGGLPRRPPSGLYDNRVSIGDVIYSDVAKGAPEYLACDNAIYAKSSYSALNTALNGSAVGPSTAKTVSGISSCTWMSCGFGGGKFVALGRTAPSTSKSIYSTDAGETWSLGSGLPYSLYDGVAYGLGVFAACGNTGVGAAWAYSSDGIGWSAGTGGGPAATSNIAFGNSRFVAVVGSGATFYSTDGISWSAGAASPATGDAGPPVICSDGSKFVMLPNANNGAVSATTTTGVSWTSGSPAPPSLDYTGVTYGNGLFVAVAYNTATYITSTDGLSWTSRTLPLSSTWQAVRYGNGMFVVVSNGSECFYSTDGLSWGSLISGFKVYQSSGNLAYGNGVFIGFDENVTTSCTKLSLNYDTATHFAVPLIPSIIINGVTYNAYIRAN